MKPNILSASIAALFVASSLPCDVYVIRPVPAYGSNNLDPADVQDFAAHDINRIQGNIARALAKKSAFIDILEGGTIKAGISKTVRAVVQERAVLNQSLVRPTFTADIDMGGQVGPAAEVGSTEYSYFLGTNRGMGPLVNIQQMRDAFETSYSTAEDSLKKQIVHLINADIRSTLVDRSGTKLLTVSNTPFLSMYAGDSQDIDTPFPTINGALPDSPFNFALLEALSIFQRENLLVEGFDGNQSEPLLKLIAGQEQISYLRQDAGILTQHEYLAAGHYQAGPDMFMRYTWEGPYRGYAFGIDPQPLRYSFVDSDGQPIYIEPEIAVKTSNGFAARVNPLWAAALFEVAVVIGSNTFRRMTPESYNGEGTFKFPAQLNMGELMFQVIKDNVANVWGDYGRHYYQIKRAYRPERPHAVTAIAFKRQQQNFNLSPVSNIPGYSTANSL